MTELHFTTDLDIRGLSGEGKVNVLCPNEYINSSESRKNK